MEVLQSASGYYTKISDDTHVGIRSIGTSLLWRRNSPSTPTTTIAITPRRATYIWPLSLYLIDELEQ